MALSKRALRRAHRELDGRASALAAKYVRPEHVEGALKSLARGLARHVPELGKSTDMHPSELDDATIEAHMAAHAARHPNRVVPAPQPEERPSLARAQDLAAPWSTAKIPETK